MLVIDSLSFLPIYICKRLIVFNCKDAFLQSAETYSSKFNLSSIVTPNNSSTDFVILVVMFSIFNVLVLLVSFHLCNTIAWNLSRFRIILLSLNHRKADSNSSFEIWVSPSKKSCFICFSEISLKMMANIFFSS